MSDRVIVMREGRLTGEFAREDATQETIMARAMGRMPALVEIRDVDEQPVTI
jgi:ABC-type uncharacterized transport system ATPase subunit